jgi:hypothetical protein
LQVRPALQDAIPKGDVSVVDKALGNQFILRSLAIVANIALQCTEKEGAQRPSMAEVVRELKRALDVEDLLPSIIEPSLQTLKSAPTNTIKLKTFHSTEVYPSRSLSMPRILRV